MMVDACFHHLVDDWRTGSRAIACNARTAWATSCSEMHIVSDPDLLSSLATLLTRAPSCYGTTRLRHPWIANRAATKLRKDGTRLRPRDCKISHRRLRNSEYVNPCSCCSFYQSQSRRTTTVAVRLAPCTPQHFALHDVLHATADSPRFFLFLLCGLFA